MSLRCFGSNYSEAAVHSRDNTRGLEPSLQQIRPLNYADRGAILKMWHLGWHDAHAHLVPPAILEYRTPEYFALWLDQSADKFHVMADGDDLLGFVSIEGAEVVKLYVSAEAKGRGFARSLLGHAEKLLALGGGRACGASLHCRQRPGTEFLCPRGLENIAYVRRWALVADGRLGRQFPSPDSPFHQAAGTARVTPDLHRARPPRAQPPRDGSPPCVSPAQPTGMLHLFR